MKSSGFHEICQISWPWNPPDFMTMKSAKFHHEIQRISCQMSQGPMVLFYSLLSEFFQRYWNCLCSRINQNSQEDNYGCTPYHLFWSNWESNFITDFDQIEDSSIANCFQKCSKKEIVNIVIGSFTRSLSTEKSYTIREMLKMWARYAGPKR